MRILISLISFEYLTGAELYVYELSKSYLASGHQVMITAPNVGGEVALRSRELGAEVCAFEDCPSDWGPDILHVNEYMPAVFALSLYPKTPAVATVHSQFMVEKPFISKRIYKYICIRPEVQDKVAETTKLSLESTTVIYNGIDFERFKPHPRPTKLNAKKVLFVGTIDPLRKNAIEDLINDAKKNNYEVTVVGKKHDTYLDNPPKHVTVHEPTWSIEKYFDGVTETAGILLGRTTVEGWAANIPGWIYDVDLNGNLTGKKLYQPPTDLQKFNVTNVAEKILALYKQAISAEGLHFDDQSLAEAQASVIANTMKNEAKISILRGEADKAKDLINYLGSENYNVHIKLQKLDLELENSNLKTKDLQDELRALIALKNKISRPLKKIRRILN